MSIDATYAQLPELGIKTEGPPMVRPWGERDLWVLDPDGNLVEFGQARGARPPMGGSPLAGDTRCTSIASRMTRFIATS